MLQPDMNKDMLMEAYRLTKEDFSKLQGGIIEAATLDIKPVKQLTAVILGAQPGSGKTQVQRVVQENFKDNIVLCNADNFREVHPLAQQLKKLYPELYPEISAPISQLWAAGVQQYCRNNKLNYILETTLKDGEMLNKTIEALKESGFKVELEVLAVNKKVSFLGTQQRYEEMILIDGSGRTVTRQAHDMRYNAITESLRVVTQRKLYDRLNIYGRDIMNTGKKNINGVYLVAQNPDNPLTTYLNERDKEWTPQEKKYFDNLVHQVIEMKNQRQATVNEIEQFKNYFNDENRRINNPLNRKL